MSKYIIFDRFFSRLQRVCKEPVSDSVFIIIFSHFCYPVDGALSSNFRLALITAKTNLKEDIDRLK